MSNGGVAQRGMIVDQAGIVPPRPHISRNCCELKFRVSDQQAQEVEIGPGRPWPPTLIAIPRWGMATTSIVCISTRPTGAFTGGSGLSNGSSSASAATATSR